jgi:hypothetical protein
MLLKLILSNCIFILIFMLLQLIYNHTQSPWWETPIIDKLSLINIIFLLLCIISLPILLLIKIWG